MKQGFSTHLLDEAIERQRQEQEELRLYLIKKLFAILDKLNQEVFFKEAYLFGSIDKPHGFLKNSDIDIGFIGLRDEEFFNVMSYLSREIGIDVDVIQLEGHRLSEKIKKEGIKWMRKN
ncbi:MAG: hypothetical protein AB1630_02300 [bacterium]